MDGQRLMERWQDKERVYHFEMSTKNLEKLVGVLDYVAGPFGSAIENFLRDNPGAQVAIVNWITEQLDMDADWRAKFQAQTLCARCHGTVLPGMECMECGEEGEEL